MARTKAFDPDAALDQAMHVFWACGYEGTSLDTLMAGTGVARQSLYDTFGDKRAIYMLALGRYRDANHAWLRALFAAGRPIRECVAEVLLSICGGSKADLERGCMLLDAAIERGERDAELASFLRANQKALERIFTDAFERARTQGEIAPGRDPKALARFVVMTIQGMRAMGRVEPNRAVLEDAARVALAALD